MSDALGLNNTYDMSPVGVPTPQIPLMQTMHPGAAAQMAVMQSFGQAEATRAGAFGTSPTYAAQMGSPTPYGYGAAANSFAAQYANNMNVMQTSMRVGPYGYGGGAMPGLMGGMLPSPGMFTAPELGVYRQAYPRMHDTYGMTSPHAVNMFNPLVFQPQTTMFRSPLQAGMDAALSVEGRNAATLMTGGNMIGRGAVDLAASVFGGRIGATLGGLAAGPQGAVYGMMAGRLGGAALAEMSGAAGGFGSMASNFMLATPIGVPLQTQQLSKSMFVGGSAASAAGIGVSPADATALAPAIQRLSYNREYGFNTADYPKIIEQAGQAGLFNDLGSLEQGAQRLSKMSKALKLFMKITNDPDVTSAIQQLGSMRMMGADFESAIYNLKSIRGYARMGGLSPQATENAANTGALLFQNMGLSGATGMVHGVGVTGLARQAVASGAFTTLQQALLGGEQGMAQRTLESNLAFMRAPAMGAFLGNITGQGNFRLDPRAIKDLLGGKVSMSDVVTQGVGNLNVAVARRGVGALALQQMYQSENEDEAMRYMGPAGVDAAKKMMVIKEAETMRGGATPENLAMAIQRMFPGDVGTQRQMLQEMTSASFIRNTITSLNTEAQTQTAESVMARRNVVGPGYLTRAAVSAGIIDYGTAARMSESFFVSGPGATAVRNYFGDLQQRDYMGRMREQGLVPFQTPAFAQPANPLEERALRATLDRDNPANALAAAAEDRAKGIISGAYRQTRDFDELSRQQVYDLLRYRGGFQAALAPATVMANSARRSLGFSSYYDSPNTVGEFKDYRDAGQMIAAGVGSTAAGAAKRREEIMAAFGMTLYDYNSLVSEASTGISGTLQRESIKASNIFSRAEGVRGSVLRNRVSRVVQSRIQDDAAFKKVMQGKSEKDKEELITQLVSAAFGFGVNAAGNPIILGMEGGAYDLADLQRRHGLKTRDDLGKYLSKGLESPAGAAVAGEELVRFYRAMGARPDLSEKEQAFIGLAAAAKSGTLGPKDLRGLSRAQASLATDLGRSVEEMSLQFAPLISEMGGAQGMGAAATIGSSLRSGKLTTDRLLENLRTTTAVARLMTQQSPLLSHITSSSVLMSGDKRQDLEAAVMSNDTAKVRALLQDLDEGAIQNDTQLLQLIRAAKNTSTLGVGGISDKDFASLMANMSPNAVVSIQGSAMPTSVTRAQEAQVALLEKHTADFGTSVKDFSEAVTRMLQRQTLESGRGTVDVTRSGVKVPEAAPQSTGGGQ
jgi:hypothetical protein